VLLLVVVAHPDDESFGCGSILLHASAVGYETAVLCATRGEAGETRIPTDDLAQLREDELRAAALVLGVGTVRLFGWADSGMAGLAAPGTLVAADPTVVTDVVRAAIDELRPDVVVTLDASDGHRDHAVIRDATLAAVDSGAHQPVATYLACLPRSSLAKWQAHIGGNFDEAYLAADLGTPDEEITTVVDVSALMTKRWDAIRAHASQVSPFEDLPEALEQEFLGTDHLKLVRGTDVLAP
jgi:N-acetyl-1-D-myo-inositol-2-amino-2-deoxy-alpha-D-glucopyranoside deacetylase